MQLPSKKAGGKFIVRHGEEKHVFNFAEECEGYFQATSFYAGVETEMKPITSGSSLCLLYRLSHEGNCSVPSTPSANSSGSALTDIADLWDNLGHYQDERAMDLPALSAMRLDNEYDLQFR